MARHGTAWHGVARQGTCFLDDDWIMAHLLYFFCHVIQIFVPTFFPSKWPKKSYYILKSLDISRDFVIVESRFFCVKMAQRFRCSNFFSITSPSNHFLIGGDIFVKVKKKLL